MLIGTVSTVNATVSGLSEIYFTPSIKWQEGGANFRLNVQDSSNNWHKITMTKVDENKPIYKGELDSNTTYNVVQFLRYNNDYTKEWDYSKSCSDIPSGMNYYTMTTETYKDWAIDNSNGTWSYYFDSDPVADSASLTASSETVKVGDSVTLTAVADNPISTNLKYTFTKTSGGDATVVQDNNKLTVTPTVAGTYKYTVTVSADGYSPVTSTEVSFTVTDSVKYYLAGRVKQDGSDTWVDSKDETYKFTESDTEGLYYYESKYTPKQWSEKVGSKNLEQYFYIIDSSSNKYGSKDNQTDKDGNLIYLYANNKDEQYSYIEAATNKGYNVLLMDGQLDVAIISMLEQKLEKSRFTRVDSDVIDNLIVKEDKKGEILEADKQDAITTAFKSQLPKMDKVEFNVMTQALGENSAPVMITQSEYMRRMKEMANIQAGMSFYGEMPDMFNLILNSDHKLIKQVLNEEEGACHAEVTPIQSEMDSINKKRNELKDKQKGKKDEDIPTAEKDELNDLDKKWDDLKSKKEAIFAGYASNNKVIRQLIDLALLQNNMLRGEALNNFVKRSIELI